MEQISQDQRVNENEDVFNLLKGKEILEQLKKQESKKLVKIVYDHQTKNKLLLANYTGKAQSMNYHDKLNLRARGIVLDSQTGEIFALPFCSFDKAQIGSDLKNIDLNQIDYIADKLDGSLGIVYYDKYSQQWRMNTRGCFDNEITQQGMQMLIQKFENKLDQLMNKDYTYLFEVLIKKYKIQVIYDEDDVILLTAFNKKFLKEVAKQEIDEWALQNKIKRPQFYQPDQLKQIIQWKNELDNFEGWVIKMKDGKRIKIKCYKYINRIQASSHITDKEIFNLVSEKQAEKVQEFKEAIPNELFEIFDQKKEKFTKLFDQIETRIYQFYEVNKKKNHKQFEAALKELNINNKEKKLIRDLYQNKEVRDKDIWDIIRPIQ